MSSTQNYYNNYGDVVINIIDVSCVHYTSIDDKMGDVTLIFKGGAIHTISMYKKYFDILEKDLYNL